MSEKSLYERLGGYDAIAVVAGAFLPRVFADDKLRRFWDHRGADGVAREAQLLVDFLSEASGGPMLYTGRDMTLTHKGMNIDNEDYDRLLGHLGDTFDSFGVGDPEKGDVLGFVESLRGEIVET